jgi:hypothetical protein
VGTSAIFPLRPACTYDTQSENDHSHTLPQPCLAPPTLTDLTLWCRLARLNPLIDMPSSAASRKTSRAGIGSRRVDSSQSLADSALRRTTRRDIGRDCVLKKLVLRPFVAPIQWQSILTQSGAFLASLPIAQCVPAERGHNLQLANDPDGCLHQDHWRVKGDAHEESRHRISLMEN